MLPYTEVAKLIFNRWTALALVIISCVLYYRWSQQEITMLKREIAVNAININNYENSIATLRGRIQEQQKLVIRYKEDYTSVTSSLKTVIEREKQAKLSLHKLQQKFKVTASGKKRDMNKILEKKPELYSKLVNKGSATRLRCIEILTGSPETEEEKLTRKQRNCPNPFDSGDAK